jgi:hypothetical protein
MKFTAADRAVVDVFRSGAVMHLDGITVRSDEVGKRVEQGTGRAVRPLSSSCMDQSKGSSTTRLGLLGDEHAREYLGANLALDEWPYLVCLKPTSCSARMRFRSASCVAAQYQYPLAASTSGRRIISTQSGVMFWLRRNRFVES